MTWFVHDNDDRDVITCGMVGTEESWALFTHVFDSEEAAQAYIDSRPGHNCSLPFERDGSLITQRPKTHTSDANDRLQLLFRSP